MWVGYRYGGDHSLKFSKKKSVPLVMTWDHTNNPKPITIASANVSIIEGSSSLLLHNLNIYRKQVNNQGDKVHLACYDII